MALSPLELIHEQIDELSDTDRGELAAQLTWRFLKGEDSSQDGFLGDLANRIGQDMIDAPHKLAFVTELLNLSGSYNGYHSGASDMAKRILQRDNVPTHTVDVMITGHLDAVLLEPISSQYKYQLTQPQVDRIAGQYSASDRAIDFVKREAARITPARYDEFLARAMKEHLFFDDEDGRYRPRKIDDIMGPVVHGKQPGNAELIAQAVGRSDQVARSLAKHGLLPLAFIEENMARFAELEGPLQTWDSELREGLLANPSTPEKYLYFYAEDEERRSWFSLAENPKLPMDLANLLVSQGNDGVALALATNKSLDAKLWNEAVCHLARSERMRDGKSSDYIRDPRATVDTLVYLCERMAAWREANQGGYQHVAWFPAFMRTGMPGGVVARFITIVAAYKWGKDAMLAALEAAAGERFEITAAALRMMSTHAKGGSKAAMTMRLLLAGQATTPDDILVTLAGSNDEAIAGAAKSQMMRRGASDVISAYYQKESKKK